MIAGILLAAGESSRMGEPKALLNYQGATFIDSILNKLVEINCEPIITVLGSAAELICKQTRVDSFFCFQNPNPEEGMLSSLKMAIEQLPPETQGFILCLVDHPMVKQETYQSIYHTAAQNPGQIVIPEFMGKRGHPVYFGKPYFDAILNAPPDQGARVVVNSNAENVIYMPVDDEGILKDIDTPEDFKKYMQ